MSEHRKFYSSESDFQNYSKKLKFILCPFCRKTGSLILHGFLYGYAQDNVNTIISRGHRILCNKRRKYKKGCGHTFSILLSCFSPRLRYYLNQLWICVLKNAKFEPLTKLFTKLNTTYKTAHRIITRLKNKQHHIRSLLVSISDPPSTDSSLPLAKTVKHLQKAFPSADNPMIAFQLHFQTSII